MKLKDITVRVGYMLLGALLTLCSILVREEFIVKRAQVEDVVAEPIEEIETLEVVMESVEVSESVDYIAEAEARLAQLQEELEKKKLEKEEQKSAETEISEEERLASLSANDIELAPVKWIEDYPKKISSDKLLVEKEQERSSYEETLAVNTFDKKVIENSTIDFSDVKITIMGDSLTEGSNLSDEERREYSYPVLLQEILGCKEVVNLGIGGSTLSEAGQNAMVDRRKDIPLDSDIIIIFGGTNDALCENKWDFGHIEYNNRMKEATFCGDADILFSKLMEYRDDHEDNYIKLLCINPPSSIVCDGFYQIDPGNLVHQSQFAAAINQIAPEYDFEVIDFYNSNILNTHDANVQKEFMPDGIHGNAEGYRIIAEHIASQIIQRIEQ